MASAIASVFLFAGPHNFQEARYILGRLPARAGRLWPYALLSVAGWAGLSAGFLGLFWVQDPEPLIPIWNGCLVVWVASLAYLRSREHPRRSWPWLLPATLLGGAAAVNYPQAFSVGLVYLHPLTALYIADAELKAQRHPWRKAWRRSLPWLFLGLLWTIALAFPRSTAGLDGDSLRGLIDLPGDTQAWLAAHVYLESIHYAVWIVLLPLVATRLGRHQLSRMPLLRKAAWRVRAARIGFAVAGLGVIALWWAFHCDYATTRSAYFALAIGHVLVEYPFLLRTA